MTFLVSALCVGILGGCGGGGGGSAATAQTGASTTTTTVASTPTTTIVYSTAVLLMPPTVPQPVVAGTDIVGVNLENTTGSNIAAHIFTFGQIFKSGDVQPTDTLVAHISGTTYQVQLDTLATWPDGSVKLGAITLDMPAISAGSTLSVLLSKKTGSDPTFSTTPVDLAGKTVNLNVALAFTSGQYGSSTPTVDLGTPLKTALAGGSPSYWLHGPLATQARIDVTVPGGTNGALHLTADVTAYADNSFAADVQFNNDLTTILPSTGSTNPAAALPALQYTATINFQSMSPVSNTINQLQYTGWHRVLNTAGSPMLSAAYSTGSAINVQHDLAYLEHSGAILPYDRTTGVANVPTQPGTAFYSITNIMANATFGTPFAQNGLTTYMPQTGGRPDIGYTTMWNTTWLLTQDARAALTALAQSDTSGAIPWNYKLANGHWLTPSDAPAIWTDSRGGPTGYTDGIANVANTSTWTPEAAHQPNLNYVPYIMTASRWYLDRLNAQAAAGLSSSWPGARCRTSCVAHTDDIIINGIDQIRQEAWSMREIQQAAFIGQPGSFEQTYFNQVVTDNWNYVASQEASLATSGGQVYGYLGLGSYGDPTVIPEWMEDYLTGIALQGAQMGFSGANAFINWQKDSWLAARFIGTGMNPYDGCIYNLVVGSGGIPLTSWSAIESATVAVGKSNGSTWGIQSDGDYCPLARAVLGGALTLYPADTNLQQALTWLNGAGAPYTSLAAFQNDPTFNVVPLQ